jgi:biopolymer transport protein ExbD
MNKLRKEQRQESKPTVPITPMLDMTFQLLFFFITLFDPNSGAERLVEGQMDLMLPGVAKKDAAKQAQDPKDIKPDAESHKDMKDEEDNGLDIPSDLTVIVTTQIDGTHDGTINALFVEDRSGKTSVELDDGLQELVKYLKDQRDKASGESSIRVQGDSRLRWEAMVKVMDACRKAGYESVGFVQPPDFDQAGR